MESMPENAHIFLTCQAKTLRYVKASLQKIKSLLQSASLMERFWL